MITRRTALISAVVIVAVVAGTFIVTRPRPFRGGMPGFGEMEMDNESRAQVTGMFEATADPDVILEYCNDNRFDCMYYCTRINPENELCSQTRGISSPGRSG